MVQLIKKGGLRERANRSRSYQGSENTETTLKPNRYIQHLQKQQNQAESISSVSTQLEQSVIEKIKI
ncbi:hypothetical protein ACKVE0_03860 [Acinetobacter albensis]|jgi:hypothetical protein|uniref:Transposase n=1 Tax=Acinetobacter albensis TaxID=1673609 RepID=A0ABW9JUK3_9GAMM|nr:hypothetical protein [Acinetobacter sp. TTH0-4]ALD03257.1 hypothetical protein AMQ28_13470 [Acinetobacter sp. TTH0-4]QPF37092.1 hypothetical protein H0S58_08585 [Acinetobacter sp. TTH0-4]